MARAQGISHALMELASGRGARLPSGRKHRGQPGRGRGLHEGRPVLCSRRGMHMGGAALADCVTPNEPAPWRRQARPEARLGPGRRIHNEQSAARNSCVHAFRPSSFRLGSGRGRPPSCAMRQAAIGSTVGCAQTHRGTTRIMSDRDEPGHRAGAGCRHEPTVIEALRDWNHTTPQHSAALCRKGPHALPLALPACTGQALPAITASTCGATQVVFGGRWGAAHMRGRAHRQVSLAPARPAAPTL